MVDDRRDKQEFPLAYLYAFKIKIVADLKRMKYNDLEEMVYKMELTHDENITE